MRTAALLVVLVMILGCKKKDPPPRPAQDDAAALAGDAAGGPAIAADASAAAIDATVPEPVALDATAAAPPKLDKATEKAVCLRVGSKVIDCAEEPEFLAALTEGLPAAAKQQQLKFVEQIDDWPEDLCTTFAYDYEENGFRDHFEQLTAEDVVASCATLGTAVKAAGGMFGGPLVK